MSGKRYTEQQLRQKSVKILLWHCQKRLKLSGCAGKNKDDLIRMILQGQSGKTPSPLRFSPKVKSPEFLVVSESLENKTVADLKKLMRSEGLSIPLRGSGKGGAVLKKDLILIIQDAGATSPEISEISIPSPVRMRKPSPLRFSPRPLSPGPSPLRFSPRPSPPRRRVSPKPSPKKGKGFACGKKKNKCPPKKVCQTETGTCVSRGKVPEEEGYYYDAKHGLVGKRKDVQEHLKRWGVKRVKPAKTPKKQLENLLAEDLDDWEEDLILNVLQQVTEKTVSNLMTRLIENDDIEKMEKLGDLFRESQEGDVTPSPSRSPPPSWGGAGIRAPSPKPKPKKKKCTAKKNPSRCKDDKICSASTGKCVKRVPSKIKDLYVLSVDGREIVGGKDIITRLKKTLGGEIRSPRPKVSPPRRVSPKVSPPRPKVSPPRRVSPPRPKVSPPRRVSPKVSPKRKKCTDKENPLKCKDDEICSAPVGKCVKRIPPNVEGRYILSVDGRQIVGAKSTIKKLKKTLGGKIQSPESLPSAPETEAEIAMRLGELEEGDVEEAALRRKLEEIREGKRPSVSPRPKRPSPKKPAKSFRLEETKREIAATFADCIASLSSTK